MTTIIIASGGLLGPQRPAAAAHEAERLRYYYHYNY